MGLMSDFFEVAVATSIDIYNDEKKRIMQEQKAATKREEERNFLIESDLLFARTLLSVWIYTFRSDGTFTETGKEFEFFENLCEDYFFGENKRIFVDLDLTDQELDDCENIILDAIDNPISISEIKSFTRGDNEFRLLLLEQAIWCAKADEVVEKAELKFLKDLSKELRISSIDRDMLFKKYSVTI